MAKDLIGYEALADKALRSVVKEALRRVEKQGLLGAHHFYLTFKTHDPGVEIPDFLLERYPEEMTIVLQNQFWGLKVGEDQFEVGLTFQKVPATLVIPFAALTAFVDPSVQFGLQFRNSSAAKGAPAPRDASMDGAEPKQQKASKPQAPVKDAPVQKLPGRKAPVEAPAPAPPAAQNPDQPAPSSPQVVSFDKFRKK
jgi:hypothetical protein